MSRRSRCTWSPRALAHRIGQIAVDLGLVAAAYWLAFYFRFDGDVPGRYERLFAATVLIVIALKLVVFVAMRFYTKWWRFTSLRDLQAIVLAAAASSLIVIAVLSQWRPDDLVPVPRGVLVFDFVLTLPSDRRRALRRAQRHRAPPALRAGAAAGARCSSAAPATPATRCCAR